MMFAHQTENRVDVEQEPRRILTRRICRGVGDVKSGFTSKKQDNTPRTALDKAGGMQGRR